MSSILTNEAVIRVQKVLNEFNENIKIIILENNKRKSGAEEVSQAVLVEWVEVEWIWTIDLGTSNTSNHIFHIRWYSSIFS